ncbi:lysyl-tRNA synthetase [Pedococcus sp.]|uniref:lysyl-tRNA synthetase n=1 Tax=Pedococcus sp. TaxID=2860345 RepID=UPI002E0E7BFA|nr:lysyl-tRNA synthetase [Pedococcus sp.]
MSTLWPYLAALIPSAGVGFLFWLVIKNMIEGDRKERLAHSQWERTQEHQPEIGHSDDNGPTA